METPKMPEAEREYSWNELKESLKQVWNGTYTWDVPFLKDGEVPNDHDQVIAAHPGLSKLSDERFERLSEEINDDEDEVADYSEVMVPRKLYGSEPDKD